MEYVWSNENVVNTFQAVMVCIASGVGVEAGVEVLELEVYLQVCGILFGWLLVEVDHDNFFGFRMSSKQFSDILKMCFVCTFV